MWTILLIVLLVLALGGGFYGRGPERNWGAYGWSPLGLLLVVLLVLLLTGNLNTHGCSTVRL